MSTICHEPVRTTLVVCNRRGDRLGVSGVDEGLKSILPRSLRARRVVANVRYTPANGSIFSNTSSNSESREVNQMHG